MHQSGEVALEVENALTEEGVSQAGIAWWMVFTAASQPASQRR
jgi:hypothetical protein